MRFLIAIITLLFSKSLFAAEAGMPQLDPTYWASQAFWLILIFVTLYISISRFFIPKIKDNLDDREKKIKNDLEEAKKLQELSEERAAEYLKVLKDGKKEVTKILAENSYNLKKEIQDKKNAFEKIIDKEVEKAQKQINDLKKNSIESIYKISEQVASDVIKQFSGEELNNSSVKAVIEDTAKKNLNKYL